MPRGDSGTLFGAPLLVAPTASVPGARGRVCSKVLRVNSLSGEVDASPVRRLASMAAQIAPGSSCRRL